MKRKYQVKKSHDSGPTIQPTPETTISSTAIMKINMHRIDVTPTAIKQISCFQGEAARLQDTLDQLPQIAAYTPLSQMYPPIAEPFSELHKMQEYDSFMLDDNSLQFSHS